MEKNNKEILLDIKNLFCTASDEELSKAITIVKKEDFSCMLNNEFIQDSRYTDSIIMIKNNALNAKSPPVKSDNFMLPIKELLFMPEFVDANKKCNVFTKHKITMSNISNYSEYVNIPVFVELLPIMERFLGVNLVLVKIGSFILNKDSSSFYSSEYGLMGTYENENSIVVVQIHEKMSEKYDVTKLVNESEFIKGKTRKNVKTMLIIRNAADFVVHDCNYSINKEQCIFNTEQSKIYTLNKKDVNSESYTLKSVYKNFNKNFIQENSIGVPFPQADDFGKVIEFIEFLCDGPKSSKQITDHFNFSSRQSDYYANAAKYLGFVDGNASKYQLTEFGASSFLPGITTLRDIAIFTQILRHEIFFNAIRDIIINIKIFDNDSFLKNISNDILNKIENVGAEATSLRRAKTVKS